MKRLLLFICMVMLGSSSIKAQITLEHTLDSVSTGGQFYCTDLGNHDFKYVFIDTAINGFKLYNMNMTHYLTVNVPYTGNNQIKQGYTVIYITRTLFDCDSTNIEYIYEAPYTGLTKPFFVYRTDGALLLQVDSANGPYSFGGYGGALDIRPVINTSDGTKIFVQYKSQNGTGLKIFSVCGTLPTTVYDFSERKQFVKIFPNPASQELNFIITLPDNLDQYELVLLNNNSQELRRDRVAISENLSIDVSNYNNGIYYYSLTSKNKILQTGKFILTK